MFFLVQEEANQPITEHTTSTTEIDSTTPASNSHTHSRQKKRLEHYLQRKEIRRELRKAYKNRRKAKRSLTQQLSNDGSELRDQPNVLPSRKALSHAPRMSESPCMTKIVIDCAHDHLMSFKDICKLANQITNCYAFNRRLNAPVQLYVTGLKADLPSGSTPPVRLHERLSLAGSDCWDINLCDEDYSQLFDGQSIVYLCAESPVLLPDRFTDEAPVMNEDQSVKPISAADVFVIGGLVDHNHRLGYCYNRAQERGHRTARLPIKESGMLLNGRHVLSTLEVFEALAPVVAGSMTWSESLNAAIPSRKKLTASA